MAIAIKKAPPKTVEQLVEEWAKHKHDEEAARLRRLDVEDAITAVVKPLEEGSESHRLANGWTLQLTGKLNYTLDCEPRTLQQIWDELREMKTIEVDVPVPLKTKVELDATGAKWIRANRPDIWRFMSKVVTTKPAKVAVNVKI
jgi:hypothetical protein